MTSVSSAAACALHVVIHLSASCRIIMGCARISDNHKMVRWRFLTFFSQYYTERVILDRNESLSSVDALQFGEHNLCQVARPNYLRESHTRKSTIMERSYWIKTNSCRCQNQSQRILFKLWEGVEIRATKQGLFYLQNCRTFVISCCQKALVMGQTMPGTWLGVHH